MRGGMRTDMIFALEAMTVSRDERCSGLSAREIIHTDRDGLTMQETWSAPAYSKDPITFCFTLRWEDWAQSVWASQGAEA